MNARDEVIDRLRRIDPLAMLPSGAVQTGIAQSGVRFAAKSGPLEQRWNQALSELSECVRPIMDSSPVLNEGGVYRGSWLESTGTINAEILSRFVPSVTENTHLLFAKHQRADGMLPYKMTDSGAGFSQIQIVTPLARTVWNHYLLNGRDRRYLSTMYSSMQRYDAWLAHHRDTLSTGGVEAFCAFDTGHDLSPRFWFAPDRCLHGEATLCDPDTATLPHIAPDLTANVVCQREYLALIAAELGEDPEPWRAKSRASLSALWAQCFDEVDGTFYDRDRSGALVRIQSDVLLRVLACEVGDDGFFAEALERYLMNTRKFLSHYGFTSLALDDPRFDGDYRRNSWGGPVNFLSLIRAPHAFDAHGRVAELAIASMPVLAVVAIAGSFPQCLDPWTGSPGYTEVYSPSILWFLDAVERWCGILARPDGELWFTGLAPTRLDHGAAAEAVAYARVVDGVLFELAADDADVVVFRDGVEHLTFPRGWRVVADRSGGPASVVGLLPRPVSGTLTVEGEEIELSVNGNDRVELVGLIPCARRSDGVILPHG